MEYRLNAKAFTYYNKIIVSCLCTQRISPLHCSVFDCA